MIFTDEEMKIVLLVAVYGRQEGLDKLRQLRIDNVPQDMKDLHASVIGKMERLSDEDFATIDFIGFLERSMKGKSQMKEEYKHTDDDSYQYCKDQILQEPNIPLHLQNLPYAEEIYDRMLKDPDFSGYEPRPQFVQYKKSQWICMGRDAYEDLQRQMQGWMADLQSELIELLGCVESMPSWDNLAETEKEK